MIHMKYKYFIGIIGLLISYFCIQITAVDLTITTDNATITITGDSDKRFGHSMAFLGTLVAGEAPFYAISEPFDSGNNNQGTLYLFQESQFTASLTTGDAIISLLGSEDQHRYGIFLASGGDIDGDGLHDFIILSPQAPSDQVMIYFGKDYGSWNAGNIISYDSPFLTTDDTNDNYLAASMASIAGDLNGDGYDDIVIGAAKEDSSTNEEGRVYIIFGGPSLTGGTLESDANTIITGTNSSVDNIGYSVSIINDINQDGYDELLIGNYNEDANLGYAAYLFYGTYNNFSGISSIENADAIFYSKETNNDGFSETVASIGDINDDGYGDFAIGAPNANSNEGAIYLYLGQETKLNHTQTGQDSYKKITVPGNTKLGLHGIYGGYDLTGDTIHDLIINDPEADETTIESTYILAGKTTEFTDNINLDYDASFRITHTHASDHHFSFSTGLGSDQNKDGIADILIGANQLGIAYLFELVPSNEIATANVNELDTLELFSDDTYTTVTTNFKVGDWVYIQANTDNPQISTPNLLPLLVTHNNTTTASLLIHSIETGDNTGIYQDKFKLVGTRTNRAISQVQASKGQTITVKSPYLETFNTALTVENSTPTLSQVTAEQVGVGAINTSIYISYFLQDMDNDTVTLIPEYRISEEDSWNPLTNWDGSTVENTDTIQAYDIGELHTTQNIPIIWSSLGRKSIETVYIRLKADDGTSSSNYIELDSITLDNTEPDRPKFDPITSERITKTKYSPYIIVTANAEANSTVSLYTNKNEAAVASATTSSEGIVTFNSVFISDSENTSQEIHLKATDQMGFESTWSNTLIINLGPIDLNISDPFQATANIPFNVTQNELLELSLSHTSPPTNITNYTHKATLSLSAKNKTIGTFDANIPISITLPEELSITDNVKIYYLNINTNTWEEQTTNVITALTTTSINFLVNSLGTFSVVQHDFPASPSSDHIYINNEIIKDNDYYPPSFTITTTLSDDANISIYKLSITNQSTLASQDIEEININEPTKDISLSVTTLTNGTYTIELLVTDEHGNIKLKSHTIKVDTSVLIFTNLAGPNPFNPLTGTLRIGSTISTPADQFSVIIIDQTGNTIWEHHHDNPLGGYFITEWNGYDTHGNIAKNGIYYIYCLIKKDSTIKKEQLIIAILK